MPTQQRLTSSTDLTLSSSTAGSSRLVSRAGRAIERREKRKPKEERGIASVLAMMFLVLFSSLTAAMAIASRGNIRTAATHIHVMRAQSAADTGMAVAAKRLKEATARFVISNSVIDASYGLKIWKGNLSGTGSYTVLPPVSGYSEGSLPAGISQALANMHAADTAIVSGVGVSVPTIGGAIAGVSASEYQSDGWLFTPAVAVETAPTAETKPLSYSITYAPLQTSAASTTDIRVIVTGYDFNYSRVGGAPIARTIMQDFRLAKRVSQAIVSPSRIMIGKNVSVIGDLGARYDDVTRTNGDPMTIRSDFVGLDTNLDKRLTDLFASLKAADIDGDNRLRIGHPVEGAGIPVDKDYDGDGTLDQAFADVTGDGYLDEMDVFIKFYDKNNDKKVALSSALTAGTPAQSATPEFVTSGGNGIDEDLAFLLDSASPDRNRNGIYGFTDTNRNGKWDAGEAMLDYDAVKSVNRDQVLGYRDGYIDRKDQYGKVRGTLIFRTSKSAWATAQGDLSGKLRGPIRAPAGKSAQNYGASTDVLPDLSPSTFDDSTTALKTAANGQSFAQQVADQLGVSVASLATYVETKSASSPSPRFLRLDGDANLDGRPDNWGTAYFEKMPFNSPNYADWYFRPVYENMVFRDAKILDGSNALFRNCTFVGVTYVKSYVSNTHRLWGEYGKLQMDSASGKPAAYPPRTIYGNDAGETNYPTMLPSTAIPPTEMILMGVPELDKGDVPSNMTGRPGYSLLPDPLVISGKRVVDTKRFSNNLRFHDCLFVGSVVSDSPTTYTQSRNKLQFTGATRFTDKHPDAPDDATLNPQSDDLAEIAKSSMMLPGYSVDIGSFNSPPTQDVQLKGAIIAGILDVRGNTTIEGALLLTFAPVYGQAPFLDAQGNPVGNPAGFNTTIGYFGPEDGDSESIDPRTLPMVSGVKIVGWDLDGDGLPDLGPTETPTAAQLAAGAVAVPFYGYGHIQMRLNTSMQLPNGLLLPMQIDAIASSYREGNP